MRVTTAGLIVVTGPRRISTYDHRGRALWHRNLAPGDRLVGAGGNCLHLLLADGLTATALSETGRMTWQRPIHGQSATLSDGALMTVDAAAVHSMTCRGGRDTWSFMPDRTRSLRLLEVQQERVLMLGATAERRVLFALGLDGTVLRTTRLPAGTRSAAEMPDGRIMARTPERLAMVDAEGAELWSRPLSPANEAAAFGNRVATAEIQSGGPVVAQNLDRRGRASSTCRLDPGGEAVTLRLLGGADLPTLVAACAGPLSACADRALSAGPFNRLWACPAEGPPVEMLPRRDSVFFEAAVAAGQRAAVATSSHEGPTAVLLIDRTLTTSARVELPGRRMLGPVAGPDGTWLVATCSGARCEPPYALVAVSTEEEP